LGVASHVDAAANANGDFVVVWEEAFSDEFQAAGVLENTAGEFAAKAHAD
jgi:hypothetical protein